MLYVHTLNQLTVYLEVVVSSFRVIGAIAAFKKRFSKENMGKTGKK